MALFRLLSYTGIVSLQQLAGGFLDIMSRLVLDIVFSKPSVNQFKRIKLRVFWNLGLTNPFGTDVVGRNDKKARAAFDS